MSETLTGTPAENYVGGEWVESHSPVVLVSPQIRAALKKITESQLPNLVVLSFNEVTRDTEIVSVALVSAAVPS